MDKIFTKHNILFGFLLVAFIIIFEIILARLSLPAWPAFMVMIFFFVAHEDAKLAPNILIGGLAGIACVVLLKEFHALFDPSVGSEVAKLAFVGLFVYAIVMLQNAVPYVFNSYAFMFFLVAALAEKASSSNPYIWMGVEFIVGGIFIAGVIGISRIVDALLKGGEAAPVQDQ
ncbi:MAG TPA: hypothetical protein PLA83_00415 [Deltaproteobacteria bacterium]|jgi:hypothetical protein|nr:hypothetical protein [Deltaproteobacteria bacterium]HQI00085.1 hypothetical protein [Deltaproteobacteria bacterium]HQJ08015.1 hypothetical protein [Deltaproteobacteria bacterium]